MVICRLQNSYGLEKYISLKSNVYVNNNIINIENIPKMNKSLDFLIKHIIENHLSLKCSKIDRKKFIILEISSDINYVNRKEFYNSGYFKEYTKYKDKLKQKKFNHIVLAHPNIINDCCFKKFNTLFCLDGMHRIMSNLENENHIINSYIIINISDISKFLDLSFLTNNSIFNYKYYNFIFSHNQLSLNTNILKQIKNITVYSSDLTFIYELIINNISINDIITLSYIKTKFIKKIVKYLKKIDFSNEESDWVYIDLYQFNYDFKFKEPMKGYIVYGDNFISKKFVSKKYIGKLNNNNVFIFT